MTLLDIVDYDIINYKKASMFLIFPRCSMKCNKECGRNVCQNAALLTEKRINIDVHEVAMRYVKNPLTHAIVLGGMEPFDSWNDLIALVAALRSMTLDDIVIYTGYKEDELSREIDILKKYFNIIIKFGRFIPDDTPHYDELLGITLASSNQYAKKVSR